LEIILSIFIFFPFFIFLLLAAVPLLDRPQIAAYPRINLACPVIGQAGVFGVTPVALINLIILIAVFIRKQNTVLYLVTLKNHSLTAIMALLFLVHKKLILNYRLPATTWLVKNGGNYQQNNNYPSSNENSFSA
jgi:hypothetical protein